MLWLQTRKLWVDKGDEDGSSGDSDGSGGDNDKSLSRRHRYDRNKEQLMDEPGKNCSCLAFVPPSRCNAGLLSMPVPSAVKSSEKSLKGQREKESRKKKGSKRRDGGGSGSSDGEWSDEGDARKGKDLAPGSYKEEDPDIEELWGNDVYALSCPCCAVRR